MDIISTLAELHKSAHFKDWNKEHKQHYLTHAFKLIDDANQRIWQIGYYDPKSDTITTFVLEEGAEVKIIPDLEVFKEEKDAVRKLEIEKVRLEPQEALD